MDERDLKSLKNLCVGALLIVTVITLVLTAQHLGYDINILDGIEVEGIIQFFAFTLFGVSIGGILNTPRGLSREEKDILREKTRALMAGNILYLGYIIFAVVVIKNFNFIALGVILEGIYINVILVSRALHNHGLNDTQRQWREAMNGTSGSVKDTSILWRFKVWIRPFERVAFKERHLRSFNIIYFIFYLYLLYNSLPINLVNIIFLIIYIRCCLAILEYILGLYTSIIGVCTGVKGYEESPHHHNHGDGGGIRISTSRRRRYWEVYITDFRNKREIVYKTYKQPYIYEGDEAKVIHGIFSKEVVSLNNNKVH
ncbi:MAG: hypothetical protein E6344_10015 [Clostridium sp.]|uniref:hypothetical protein n=1 Tax=Clostridium culturomicium TaxID=1499683 RepID=UPI00058E657C|nr:hypothetical protein [Clostridium culturomicium]MDU4890540.1 hypothetical protein [Clostridium sp.]MDU7084018.1 hypothetical protein [Clostridium sp.]